MLNYIKHDKQIVNQTTTWTRINMNETDLENKYQILIDKGYIWLKWINIGSFSKLLQKTLYVCTVHN